MNLASGGFDFGERVIRRSAERQVALVMTI